MTWLKYQCVKAIPTTRNHGIGRHVKRAKSLMLFIFFLPVVALPFFVFVPLVGAARISSSSSTNLVHPLENRLGSSSSSNAPLTSLPDFDLRSLGASKIFAGTLTVNEVNGRALFYTFVTADVDDYTTAPVTMWLNGGPGCSSVGGGFMSEMGPFYPDANAPLGTKLVKNEYAWNRVSNMLYLEQPAGVGFSYTNTTSDLKVGDERSADDVRTFLLRFFAQQHPELAKNAFFIAGESYGGHYVPSIATAIVNGNAKYPHDLHINLQGIAVGNAWVVPQLDNYGAAYFWVTHAIISKPTFDKINETCNFFDVGPLLRDEGECDNAVDAAMNEMGNINIYEIYAPVCVNHQAAKRVSALANAAAPDSPFMRAVARKLNRQHTETTRAARRDAGKRNQPGYDPCIEDGVAAYLNRPDVQAALHANRTGLPYPWSDCSSIVEYSRKDLLTSRLPEYQNLVANGIRVLVYSGDVDAIVPVTGTRLWVAQMGLREVAEWQSWVEPKTEQVGGYVVSYEKDFTFATVRNSGHMAPYVQPVRSLHMFETFLSNGKLTAN